MSELNQRKAHQILQAKFDPRLKTYVYVGGCFFLIITIFGIVLLPFWLIFGRMYINNYYNNLYCELTTRALHFKKGVWFHRERTVPLDKIQDLTFREGPVLRYWGLSTLQIETAGQSVQGTADMSLTGIVDARQFREMVLTQRDDITDRAPSSSDAASRTDHHELLPLLTEMHTTLKRIEEKLG